MIKILIAENNSDFAYTMNWYFSSKGYKVYISEDGADALELFVKSNPNIVILDYNMSGELGGLQVFKEIRKTDKKVPIITLLAGKTGTEESCHLEECKSNHIMRKPISVDDIERKIESILDIRSVHNDVINLGNSIFNFRLRKISKGKELIELTTKESAVLTILAQNKGEIVSSNDVLCSVWGDVNMEDSLRNNIGYLRKKLKDNEIDASIETVRGVGYKLVLER